jgi:hypothetical protein
VTTERCHTACHRRGKDWVPTVFLKSSLKSCD